MEDSAATIKIGDVLHEVSPNLFGLFIEDINFACDGGLNANMVVNYSFGGVYPKKSFNMLGIYLTKHWPGVREDRLRYWKISGGTLQSLAGAPGRSEWFARVNTEKGCLLRNYGYNGHAAHKDEAAMGIRAGEIYHFSCWMRGKDFEGTVSIHLEDDDGRPLTDQAEVTFTNEWQETRCDVKAQRGGYGRLVIAFKGTGSIDIDCVRLEPDDVWGRDDPKWSATHLRRDLVEALRDLHPTFMRFPGGCIVEGTAPYNEYEWKKTVGPLIDREEKFNLWASGVKDKGYMQTNQVGFYEYFLLCEDLHMEPLPVVWAGIHCQARSRVSLPTESEEFQERVVQNALDLIEFANGDPATSEWAKVRADMGHPEPFNMKMIGIGNENFGEDYLKKFRVIKATIDERYPGIDCVLAAGGSPDDEDFARAWEEARSSYDEHVLVDEHFYRDPDWVYTQIDRYDGYPRGTARVFLGEYAARSCNVTNVPANSYQTALAEAAFLTGIERNSDVVAMCCYAPTFCLADCGQWAHNLIYYNALHVERSANYYVQQLYAAHQGEQVMGLEGNLPEGVRASAEATDGVLIIKLVNTGKTTMTVKVDCDVPDGTASIDYLAETDPDTANSLAFRGDPMMRVQPKHAELPVAGGILRLELEPTSLYVAEVAR